MPTEKLYEEVEKRFVKSLDSKSQKCQSNFKGRVKSLKSEIDEEDNTKIITVAEDLSKIPSANFDDCRLPAERLNRAVPTAASVPVPATASNAAPVIVNTTAAATTTTEVCREAGLGGIAASGSSAVGTSPTLSPLEDENDASSAYPNDYYWINYV